MLFKNLISLVLLSVLLCPFNTTFAADNVLNIYTWAGYLSDAVISQFETETGIHVNVATYVNNEVLYAKLKANPDSGYDIIMPSSYFISRMRKQALIQKIDHSKLAHYRNINPAFLSKEHDPDNEYSIPYLWNGTGIAYNIRYQAEKSVNTWQDFWLPRYKNQLLLIDDTRECFSMALIALGYSVNDQDPDHIKAAFEKLKALMPNVKLFNMDAQRSIYLDEDITIGMGLNGDIFLASAQNSYLRFIYPKEGFVITLDSIAIPVEAKHVANAHLFIDFVLRPEIAKKIALESGFSTPNRAAKELLPLKVRTNPILYPDAETLKKGQFQTDVGEAAPLYEKYFERLKLEE
ncbi:MAG TPA: spermidine/putrescine ABC transporter substrate-binding protein [Gammaproteobacteria bacterium]|nr:spermidine/putrescine ABC transporter substrate-binding protein [Gammaproteobacteria bacterium]